MHYIILFKLELCRTLPAVTPLTILELCLAFPAVTPQHCCDARRPTARLRTRRSRAPPAGVMCMCTRRVKSGRSAKSMNHKNTKKITDSWECGCEHNLRFWWRWHQPFRSCLLNTRLHNYLDYIKICVRLLQWRTVLSTLAICRFMFSTFYLTI